MTERKGRIEEWDDILYGIKLYAVNAIGCVEELPSDRIDSNIIPKLIAQGNAFYDRESAELAARKRAAQVKWERLQGKGFSTLCQPMGEDMELLK